MIKLKYSGKTYIPRIKRFCGGCIETDEIMNKITLKPDIQAAPIFSLIFSESTMPDWPHRLVISYGILEFFVDLVSLNPNNELSEESLYLCSPIETSFGYTYG
jgi:hypothetical protein